MRREAPSALGIKKSEKSQEITKKQAKRFIETYKNPRELYVL